MRATFTVPGPPIPKGRPRVTRGNTYTPPTSEAYERKVGMCARMAGLRKGPGEFVVSLSFFMATSRRVDVDNLVKSQLDALNGIAWEDDSQVREIHASRMLDRENPRAVVMIEGGE